MSLEYKPYREILFVSFINYQEHRVVHNPFCFPAHNVDRHLLRHTGYLHPGLMVLHMIPSICLYESYLTSELTSYFLE